MSIVNLYSIYDTKAWEYGPIFEAVNEKVAIRSYFHAMRNSPWPEDFILRWIGTLDRATGNVMPTTPIVDIPVSLPEEVPSEQPENI